MRMTLDEFVTHKASARESGGKILNWKKRKPPSIVTWLHTQAPIVALWRHGWPRVVEIERDGEKVREVWGGTFNCWEDEDVLRRQYRRNQDGGRLVPPKACPMCKMIEWVRGEVEADRINWLEPIFEFKADDERASQVLTATGVSNGYNGELSRAQVGEMRNAGLRRDEAWKENLMAKCGYLFAIVDSDAPNDGVQVCIETTALGDAVKRVIHDQMDALGETEGHPLKNPYAIKWRYQPDEQEFSRKYHAVAQPKIAMTPEIRDLIVDGPPPDLDAYISRGNADMLRATMESAALIALPFDEFFAESGARPSLDSKREEPAKRPAKAEPAKAEPAKARTRDEAPRRRVAKRAPVYPPGTSMLPCEKCGEQMAESDEVCWNCGAKYEIEPEPAPPPPPKRVAKREESAKRPSKSEPAKGDDWGDDEVPWG